MFYNLNQEGETSKVHVWEVTFYVGTVPEQELRDMIAWLNKDKIFESLKLKVPEILNKWNYLNVCRKFYELPKEAQYHIISLIIKQYEDYTWVSILQQEV